MFAELILLEDNVNSQHAMQCKYAAIFLDAFSVPGKITKNKTVQNDDLKNSLKKDSDVFLFLMKLFSGATYCWNEDSNNK